MHHPSIAALWSRYRAKDISATAEPPVAEHFCDNEADANACVDLVLAGIKRATASALASYQAAEEPLPVPGKLTIITNWSGEAKALIRTHTVTVRRFDDVPDTFAILEGEGNGSLAWWRDTHRSFWERALPGHSVDHDFLVVCEEFELIAIA